MAVAKVMCRTDLFILPFKVNKRPVIGGGVGAGMQAAPDCGDGGPGSGTC